MLYRNGPGLIIADFRIDIPYNLLIHLLCHCIFPVKLLDGFQICPHSLRFCLIQRAKIFRCRLKHSLLLRFIQCHALLQSQKIHRLNLRAFGKHGFLHIFFQRYAIPGNLPNPGTVHIFILVLGIGKIYHNLCFCTAFILNSENLVFPKAGGKYDLCSFPNTAGNQSYYTDGSRQSSRNNPLSCVSHFILISNQFVRKTPLSGDPKCSLPH